MPELAGFCDGSYTAESRTVAVSRTMNLYPEVVSAVSGKSRIALFQRPGLQLACTLPDQPVRGMFAGGLADQLTMYAAAGSTLFQLAPGPNNTLVPTALGAIHNDGSPVQMFLNNSTGELFIVSSQDALIWDGTTLTDLASLGIVSAQQGAYLDGYFIAMTPGTNFIRLSGLNDGKTWDPLDVATKEGGGDALLAILSDHELLWLFGEKTTEVWYDSGALAFPLERIPGAFIEQGIIAPYSAAKVDNSIFWLGGKDSGGGIVFRSQGFSPVRVSDHAMEAAISQYYLFDAIASTYVMQGHTFYQLHFPTSNATWVYDTAIGRWHEEGWWNTSKSDYDAHAGRYHAFFKLGHYVGDYRNGNIYVQDKLHHTDNGNPMRWLRRSPHVQQELKWIKHKNLQLDMQVGGRTENQPLPLNNPLQNPEISMRWSDDGGQTWTDPKLSSAGPQGQYKTRVIWRRLGRARDRVYEVFGSDPIEVAIAAAYINEEPGSGA